MWRRRADRHVGTPVAGDQHGVFARFCDGVRQPAARTVLEVGERDAGPAGRRREVARVVGGGDDREAMLARRDGARRSRAGLVRAGSDAGDAGRLEVVERVQQRLRAVVERVVVGERHAVDADAREQLGRERGRAEEERLPGRRPPLAARRDAALEVEDEQVGLVRDRHHVVVERRTPGALDLLSHRPPEHRVSRQRDPHAPRLRPLAPPSWLGIDIRDPVRTAPRRVRPASRAAAPRRRR